MAVAANQSAMTSMPAQLTRYRRLAVLPRSASSAAAVIAPTTAPCQSDWTIAQPRALAIGLPESASVMLLLLVGGKQAPDGPQFLRGGLLRGQGLHHE